MLLVTSDWCDRANMLEVVLILRSSPAAIHYYLLELETIVCEVFTITEKAPTIKTLYYAKEA